MGVVHTLKKKLSEKVTSLGGGVRDFIQIRQRLYFVQELNNNKNGYLFLRLRYVFTVCLFIMSEGVSLVRSHSHEKDFYFK